MTSSCIRLVWQPIQHKDRQRAESGETDSWVAANRQGGPICEGSNRLSGLRWHAHLPIRSTVCRNRVCLDNDLCQCQLNATIVLRR